MRADIASRNPLLGSVLCIGIFGIVLLVGNGDTRTPFAPFNGTSPEMTELGAFFRREGLYTFVRWNYFFTNPPLCITEGELREGFAIIDRALAITNKAAG
jgi:taurine--2-oxoglutarate transaminase